MQSERQESQNDHGAAEHSLLLCDPKALWHKLWGRQLIDRVLSSEHVYCQKNQALCWQYGLYAGTVKLLVSAKKLAIWEAEEERKTCMARYERRWTS